MRPVPSTGQTPCNTDRRDSTMPEIVVEFIKERDTKNTVKFEAVVGDGRDRGAVGSLYVLKKDLEKIGSPQKIRVTIEVGGEE